MREVTRFRDSLERLRARCERDDRRIATLEKRGGDLTEAMLTLRERTVSLDAWLADQPDAETRAARSVTREMVSVIDSVLAGKT